MRCSQSFHVAAYAVSDIKDIIKYFSKYQAIIRYFNKYTPTPDIRIIIYYNTETIAFKGRWI